MRKHRVFTFSRYDHFFFWSPWSKVPAIIRERNCQYLGSWTTNRKSKDTMLSQTLKVEEKKVTIFFLYLTQESRYGHFVIVHVLPFVDTSFVDLTRNRNISHNDQILIFSKKSPILYNQAKKILTCFYELSKLDKSAEDF